MGTNNNEVSWKYNKPLQKIFNSRRQMLKARSLININMEKNEDHEDQECRHLLENSEEELTELTHEKLKEKMKDFTKQKDKTHKFELLKDLSIAKVSISDHNWHRSRRRSKSHNGNPETCDNSKGDNEAGKSPIDRQHTNLNLTEVEKLQLRFVLTQQNCADCGLW